VLYYRNFDYPKAIENLRLIIKGGSNESGIPVEPLALNYGRIAEYFQVYGLALARSGICSEAVQMKLQCTMQVKLSISVMERVNKRESNNN